MSTGANLILNGQEQEQEHEQDHHQEQERWVMCRACLGSGSPSSMVSLFCVHISRKLMSLCGIQVWSGDGLPAHICRDCLVKLDASFQFKKQCERVDQKLRLLRYRHQQKPPDQQQLLHQDFRTAPTHHQPLPVMPVEVQSNTLPLTNSTLTDLSHSVPMSLKNQSSLLVDTLLNDANNLENIKTEKKGYQCKTCFKIYETPVKLSRHMYVHTGLKPFTCEICNKAFSHNSNLKAHMKLHSDEKPFICGICQKGCKRSKDLNLHMRTHTGEKPYVCNTCGKAFSSQSNLIAHYRTHRGEKPYVCSICQKAFCQSNELTKHKKVHVKEKQACEICNKTFNSSAALIVHVMNHNDNKSDKSNTCNICYKSFLSETSLSMHLKKHEMDQLTSY